jgi:ankyrin repeat protein
MSIFKKYLFSKDYFEIKEGSNINYRNPDGMTSLFIAVLHYNIPVISSLLQNHIDDTIQDNNGNTALICACMLTDNYEIINILSNNPCTINMANKDGKTPFLSLFFDDERIIDLLCSKNADIQATDNNGNNALHLAVISKKTSQKANEKILLKLLSLGLDINAKNNAGETPLFLAFKHYEYDKAKILAQNNADFSIENDKGESVMFISEGSMFTQRIFNDYNFNRKKRKC